MNNIDDPALIYENKSNDKKERPYATIKLKGPEKNINAIGAKIIQFGNGSIHVYENYPVKGFLSSMQIPLHIGLYRIRTDSAFLVWPDNTYQPIQLDTNSHQSINYSGGLPVFARIDQQRSKISIISAHLYIVIIIISCKENIRVPVIVCVYDHSVPVCR